ncbi:MAG TPA: hypothetical protein VFV34_17050 [Blastocatellia bacterium]|nr:hypothetical protein [Blastocatellia bacterium]
MKTLLIGLLLVLMLSVAVAPQGRKWRQATDKELKALIPAKAAVESENIETELRTASGVTSGGKFIAGVVMITAGYAAEGKYSHYFITQVPIKIGDMTLQPGNYVFGKKRSDADTLEIGFYESASGKALGTVSAQKDTKNTRVYSLLITPGAGDTASIRVGRFSFDCSIAK